MLGSRSEAPALVCSARPRPRGRRRLSAPSGSRSSRPRTSGAASPPSSPATGSTVQSIIANPATDPHGYEPTAADARTIAGARSRSSTASATTAGPRSFSPPTRPTAASVARRRRPARPEDGDNPHQWYSPAPSASDRRDRRRLRQARPRATPPTSRQRKRAFERGARALRRAAAPRSDARSPASPVGYSESIFEPLGASLGLKLADPAELRQGGRGGHRGRAPPTSRRSTRQLARAPDQGLGLQQPERDPRRRSG